MADIKNATIDTETQDLQFGKAVAAACRTHESIDVALPEGQAIASIRCSAKLTKNLGNYNSASVEVHVSVPCVASQVEALYPEIERFVVAKAKAMIALKKEDNADTRPY